MLTLALARGAEAGMYWIAPLLFFGLIVLFFVLAGRRWRKYGYAHNAHFGANWKSPGLRILEERYANGEIDRDEFFARKQDLDPQPPNKKKDR